MVDFKNDIEMLNDMAKKAKKSVFQFLNLNQKQVDYIVEKVVEKAILNREKWARMAYEETELGVYEDKIIKNFLVAESVYNYMRDKKTAGIINMDDDSFEVAEPVGVIAAFTPCTNPTATAIFKILVALKTRNTIIFSPHPRALKSTKSVIDDLYEVAVEAGAPEYCIQCFDHVTLELANELMKNEDVYINWATGGKALTKAAFSSGKPSYSGGAGNVPSYIEKTADVEAAVYNILMDKMYDNSATCTSTKGLIVDRDVYHDVRKQLEFFKSYILNEKETEQVQNILINKNNNLINADCVAISAHELAKKAGINVPEDTKVLIAPMPESLDKYMPIETETITSIFKLYVCDNTEEGLALCERLVRKGGLGHSANLFTANKKLIKRFSEVVSAGRLNVNMPPTFGSATDIYANRIPSFTISCGTGANNLTTDNLNYIHFLNIKRVATNKAVGTSFGESANAAGISFMAPEKIYSDVSVVKYFEDLNGKSKTALVVTDKGISSLPFFNDFETAIRKAYGNVVVFNEVLPDPDMNIVNKGLAVAGECKPDVIIAVGGGSPIDAAKAIRVCYDIPSMDIDKLCLPFMDMRKKVRKLNSDDIKTELICIPTTCGTGSETTCAAVITDPKTHVKKPIFDFNTMYADVVLLDREAVKTLPPKIVAETGFDALVHAIEAYVSIAARVETDKTALHAIKLIYRNLEKACSGDENSKFEMLKAASDAGIAISNAFVGVNHAIGHQIGAAFGLSHGASLASVFSEVLRYNNAMPYKFQGVPGHAKWLAPKKYREIGEAIGLDMKNSDNAIEILIAEFENLMRKVGVKTTIKEYGISKEEFEAKIEKIASDTIMDMCIGANPRQVLKKEVITILNNSYE